VKGKNFSCNNAKGQRKESDFYSTPYSITKQLLEVEDFKYCKSVLEPCCGDEAIVKVLDESKEFETIHYYDIKDGTDFLHEEKKYDCIITNPPFSLAYEFILKAKEVCTEKFAFLLPLSYLHGEKRYQNIYKDDYFFPLHKIYVFTRYPMLGDELREDGKYKTGMMVYAWYIWEKDFFRQAPEINWISNQEYILNKNDKE
jgi:hypothetical protein